MLCNNLSVRQLSENSYVHVSGFRIQDGSLFPCNGVVYVNEGQAVVLDTPVSDSLSESLISWIENELHARVVALVPNHFHEDCVGGLGPFISRSVPVYSHEKTCKLLKDHTWPCKQQAFEDSLVLDIAGQRVVNRYFGEAHAPDNIVTYIPSEQLLFGGCMVKELGAGYGNLSDANQKTWSATVQKVKAAHPHAGIVVPGHGKEGGPELLDYTIGLFQPMAN